MTTTSGTSGTTTDVPVASTGPSAASSAPVTTATISPSAIGILTSGGDSQGMNCVLYGLCKSALNFTDLYLIRNGYQGLVNGGEEFIYKAQIDEIQQSIHMGGTIIGSSRCQEFRDREGRKKAARNLMIRNIHNLVVIGGDGSLTGANYLRNEWPQLVQEIIDEAKNDPKADPSLVNCRAATNSLNIIGIIGSIDNDFNGTEMTVGADSAFARITEAIDTIKTTASSHHRAMVIEVMGRNCGYLALSATLATEATYALLPEYPQPDGWQQKLRSRIEFEQKREQQTHIIILSEGARAVDGTIIKAETVRAFLSDQMGLDTRTVVLGHIQRGGQVTAFDRLMSIQLGIEAFDVLKQIRQKQMESGTGTDGGSTSEALVLTLNDGQIKAKPLLECIDGINQLNRNMLQREWSSVVEQRGKHFVNTWQNFCQLMSSGTANNKSDSQTSLSQPSSVWAVLHLAKQPVPGMNSALSAIVRYGEAMKPNVARIYAVQNGIEGLTDNRMIEMNWKNVSGYVNVGGSVIGCSSAYGLGDETINETNLGKIVATLENRSINCLCFIGDHLAYRAIKQLKGSPETLSKYPKLQQLRICFIPATIGPCSENDTGSLCSTGNPSESWIVCSSSKLGYDSLLNKVCQLLTDLHQSQLGTFNQLFMAKLRINMTAMANDFYRPSLFALANGAAHIYPCHRSWLANQTKLDVQKAEIDANDMMNDMKSNHRNQLIIVHEPFFDQTIEIYKKVFTGERNGPKLVNIDLTSLQQPHKPTPYDRKFGVKLGMQCANYFSDNLGTSVMAPASTLASRSISSLAAAGNSSNNSLMMVNSNFEIVPLMFS